ncbi:hypothetical protein Pelo_18504 [Pelomyxa schiedti]|nr:hypothetical protein Pelo_18504 [Pelomyxa schiedti]
MLRVGLKMDLVTEVPGSCVTFQEGVSAATEIKAYGYFQCSSKTYVGLDNLFEEVCRAGIFSATGSITTPGTKKSGFFGWFSKKPTTKSPETPHCVVKISIATIIQPKVSQIPNDIWLLVLEYLDLLTLIRLSRTCKEFYHLAKTTLASAMSKPHNFSGCVKVPSWKNTSFTWSPNKRFHEYTYSPVKYTPTSSRSRSGSNDQFVCFGPDCTILMSNGKHCLIRNLHVGDSVLAYYYDGGHGHHTAPALVQCIWKCPVRKAIPLVVIDQKSTTANTILELTPDHPILLLHHNQLQAQQNSSHPNPSNNITTTIRNWCLPTNLPGIPPRCCNNTAAIT